MVHALILHRAAALREQKGRCAYCKAPLSHSCATADHRLPRSRGGTARRHNIAAACERCNVAKGSMSDIELYRLIKRPLPPAGASTEILLVWAARRIWRRTHRACERLSRLLNSVPVASASHPLPKHEEE